jgi:hypothetical protein
MGDQTPQLCDVVALMVPSVLLGKPSQLFSSVEADLTSSQLFLQLRYLPESGCRPTQTSCGAVGDVGSRRHPIHDRAIPVGVV